MVGRRKESDADGVEGDAAPSDGDGTHGPSQAAKMLLSSINQRKDSASAGSFNIMCYVYPRKSHRPGKIPRIRGRKQFYSCPAKMEKNPWAVRFQPKSKTTSFVPSKLIEESLQKFIHVNSNSAMPTLCGNIYSMIFVWEQR